MALRSARAAEARSFGIGTVLGAGLCAVGRNIVPFLVSAFAIAVTEEVFSAWFTAHPIHVTSRIVRLGDGILSFLVSLVPYLLLLAVIAQGTLQDLRARKASLRGGFEGGFSALSDLLPASFLMLSPLWLMIVLILCIGHPIPWLQDDTFDLSLFILFMGSWLIVPIAVAERVGVIGMFRRSWALAVGHRWKVLCLPVMSVVAMVLVTAIVSALAEHFGAPSGIGVTIGLWFYGVIGSAISTAAYHLLLIEKEGAPAVEVADVFD